MVNQIGQELYGQSMWQSQGQLRWWPHVGMALMVLIKMTMIDQHKAIITLPQLQKVVPVVCKAPSNITDTTHLCILILDSYYL